MSVSAPDPLGPDGPFVDPLGAAAPAGEGEPMLAEVGSPEHRAAMVEIYGPNHDSWEAIERRADVLGVAPEDYVFGVREALAAERDATIEPDAAPADYPHLDWLTDQPSRPWSDDDWQRDKARAERAAAPVEMGGGGILALADFDRATWEAHVAQGTDPIATIARDERESRQRSAEIHRAQALTAARENHRRQQDTDADRAEQDRADREAFEREVRRHGQSTARARRMLAGQRVPARLMR